MHGASAACNRKFFPLFAEGDPAGGGPPGAEKGTLSRGAYPYQEVMGLRVLDGIRGSLSL